MPTCRTRRSTSPMGTCRSTSARRSSPATTSPPRSPRRSVATSTSRRASARASTRSSSESGSGKGRKVRFTGVLLGEWVDTIDSRVERFRVYRGRTGKFVLHVERSADFTMVDAGRQAGRLARLSRHRQRQLRQQRRRVDPRGRRDARRAPRAHPATALRHGRRRARAAGGRGPRHLSRRPRARRAGRGAMTTTDTRPAIRDGRPAQVLRQAGRPRRHRPRDRRGHRLRAARAEWRGQDDDRPHPVDADRRPTAATCRSAGHDVAREPDAVRARHRR